MRTASTTLLSLTGACWLFATGPAGADMVYGSQLMGPAERLEHRETLQRLSPEDRKIYRAQHHEQMEQRARALGRPMTPEPPSSRARKGRWLHSPSQYKKLEPPTMMAPGVYPWGHPGGWAMPGYMGRGAYDGYPGSWGPGYSGPWW